MTKRHIKLRQYHVTVYYIQQFNPYHIGNHTMLIPSESHKDIIDAVIWMWRESEVEDRLYPEDIKTIIITDIETKTMWLFIPYHKLGKDSFDPKTGKQCEPAMLSWKRIYGPPISLWKKRYKLNNI